MSSLWCIYGKQVDIGLESDGRSHGSFYADYHAKTEVGDKYGTTALIWASRKGRTDIAEMLLRAGASVDAVGMYSWTPLLVAAR